MLSWHNDEHCCVFSTITTFEEKSIVQLSKRLSRDRLKYFVTLINNFNILNDYSYGVKNDITEDTYSKRQAIMQLFCVALSTVVSTIPSWFQTKHEETFQIGHFKI